MQTILAFLLLLTCVFARPQHSPPIKTCDVPNPCNEPYGRCKFIEGAPRCICDNGYFGATCHIAPIKIKRCVLWRCSMPTWTILHA
uniref:EGF-like domain-containing protein n=1 Tax=Plectus sambesii TaxID=2011161 RepID=A0A914UN52_9BILA